MELKTYQNKSIPADNINEYELTPIPVNEAYVVNCSWDSPTFSKTLCIAKSYGWVFLIPLQNRCSVGYLYNKNYLIEALKVLTKEYVKISGQKIFISGGDNNFTENVSYNGNASFFLEPLEATSLNVSIRTINQCLKSLSDGNLQQQNDRYQSLLKETIDNIIIVGGMGNAMLKNTANDKAKTWLSDRYKNYPKIRLITNKSSLYYSTWFEGSFKQNLTGLDLYDKLNKFKHD